MNSFYKMKIIPDKSVMALHPLFKPFIFEIIPSFDIKIPEISYELSQGDCVRKVFLDLYPLENINVYPVL